MKASLDLRIKANVIFGKLLGREFYRQQNAHKSAGIAPAAFRHWVLMSYLPGDDRDALQIEFGKEGLNAKNIDALLRYTFKDVFGPNEWCVQ